MYDENVPLDDFGVQQAKETGAFLSALLKGKRVLFVVSPYQRTRETLDIILTQVDGAEHVDVVVEESIRELNAGIHFGKTKEELQELFPEEYGLYAEIVSGLSDKKDKRFISHVAGEGHQDVRRRVRHFARRLYELANASDEDNQYDYIIVVGHNFVNQWIYYWLNNKAMINMKTIKNCEVVVGNGENAGKSIFAPPTFVPKGYSIDLEKYREKAARSKLKEDMKRFRNNSHKWGSLLKSDLLKVEKEGFDLYIPSKNTDDYGCFLVDSIHGHDCVAYDSRSVHSYYILDGKGCFVIDGKLVEVTSGDVVRINPNQVFYYSGTMKMIEEIVPNFDEQHFHVVERISYDENKNMRSKKSN